jgi:hypothetical protein
VSAPVSRRTVVFIVRVWAEYLHAQPPGWRGVLEGVESGQKTPFTDLDEITEIIRQQTNSLLETEDQP